MSELVNSDKMSISERLAQRLKESELGMLLDEDSLGVICKEAIEKAFFEKRTEGSSYNAVVKPPLLVELATESFKEAMKAKMEIAVAELVATPAFREALAAAALAALPDMMMNAGRKLGSEAAMEGARLGFEQVKISLQNGLIR